MSKYDFYKNIEIIDDKVVATEATNATEYENKTEYGFFSNVKIGGFNISKGVGTSNVEINVEDKFEFFNKIKLDDEGNIKIKYK